MTGQLSGFELLVVLPSFLVCVGIVVECTARLLNPSWSVFLRALPLFVEVEPPEGEESSPD